MQLGRRPATGVPDSRHLQPRHVEHHAPKRQLFGRPQTCSMPRITGDGGRQLLGCHAAVLVRRRNRVLVQRLRRRQRVPDLPDYRSAAVGMREAASWLPRPGASSRQLLRRSQAAMWYQLRAADPLRGRGLALRASNVSNLRVALDAHRDPFRRPTHRGAERRRSRVQRRRRCHRGRPHRPRR